VRRPDLGGAIPHGIWARANYLGWSGSYRATRDLFQLIGDAHDEDDAYGPRHPDTLIAWHQLARGTGRAGDPAWARDLFAELAPVRERVLGAEHGDSLDAPHGLAYWTGQAGDLGTWSPGPGSPPA